MTNTVYGPYDGALSNGGDKLVLLGTTQVFFMIFSTFFFSNQDDNGFAIDSVTYDDKFPWPLVFNHSFCIYKIIVCLGC